MSGEANIVLREQWTNNPGKHFLSSHELMRFADLLAVQTGMTFT
jgi:hypothetical protein